MDRPDALPVPVEQGIPGHPDPEPAVGNLDLDRLAPAGCLQFLEETEIGRLRGVENQLVAGPADDISPWAAKEGGHCAVDPFEAMVFVHDRHRVGHLVEDLLPVEPGKSLIGYGIENDVPPYLQASKSFRHFRGATLTIVDRKMRLLMDRRYSPIYYLFPKK